MKADLPGRVRRWTRAAQFLTLLAGAVSCSGTDATGPLAPGYARLDLVPSFATVPGAPAIPLSRIKATLVGKSGTKLVKEATFVNGSAALKFDLIVRGKTENFTLDVVTFDTGDAEAFRGHQSYDIKPGPNDNLLQPVLEYSGPDALVTALHFNPSAIALDAGASTKVAVNGTGANNLSVSPVRVGWVSRNPTVATIDDAGNVVAGQTKAQTYIVARTFANVADSVLVTARGAVSQVVATPTALALFRGATSTLAVEIRDPSGSIITDRTPTFTTSDPNVATVTGAGAVTAVGVGSTSISAAVGGKTATVAIAVSSPVAGLQLSPSTVTLANIGDSQVLNPTIGAKTGAALDVTRPTFTTSDANVATVAADGRVTATGYGVATITAALESFSASTSVSVVGPLVLTQTPTVFTNATQQFSVTAGGKGPFAWSVNGVSGGNASIGQISASGVYKAPAQVPSPASLAICAIQTTPSTQGCTTVTITSSVAGVQLAPPTLTLANIGESQPLTATVIAKQGASVAGLTPTFTTSDPGVVTVGTDGRVTAAGWGVATITATIESFTATTTVSVVNTLTLTPATPTIVGNATQQFAVSTGGKGPFTWTVNGVAGGNATFGQITSGGSYKAPALLPTPAAFDICAIQTVPSAQGCTHVTLTSPVAGIQLAPPTVTLESLGDSRVLTATILPKQGASVAGLTPTFTTSDGAVASVAANGRVTATGWGVATITAKIESFTATTTVTVAAPLTISPNPVEKLPNGNQQFHVLAGGNGPFTWTVNDVAGGNATYGTIDANGFYVAPTTVPTPSSFKVCAAQAAPAATGCATITINTVPQPGADVVVLNDVNLFDAVALQDVNNQRLVSNLVRFTGTGPRAAQTGVMLYLGHAPTSPPDPVLLATYTLPDYTVTVVSNAPITTIPANYKVLTIWAPTVAFTTAEINVLKQFAAEGGRIIFMGESAQTYNGIDVENSFLSRMGAQMTNVGGAFDCRTSLPYTVIPGSQIVTTHQVMTGLTQLTMNCSAQLTPGPNDFILFRSSDGAHVLGGVAKIDVTPLPNP